jgi:hypothetical protein
MTSDEFKTQWNDGVAVLRKAMDAYDDAASDANHAAGLLAQLQDEAPPEFADQVRHIDFSSFHSRKFGKNIRRWAALEAAEALWPPAAMDQDDDEDE